MQSWSVENFPLIVFQFLFQGTLHGQGPKKTGGMGRRLVFRWFKFTLKPPYSIALDNLRLAIWDTSFWTFWLKFGHKGP